MTNSAEAIQNACEIARQDERRKFKEYLEKKKNEIDMTEEAGSFITEVCLASESNLLGEIIYELFGEE